MAEALTAIDLFAGCGGMTYGLRAAGFTVRGALELSPVAAATYRLNHGDVSLKETDIREIDPTKWMQELGMGPGDLDLMVGCPPCQGFSKLRTLNGSRSNTDERNGLLLDVAHFVRAFQPRAVMLENVPALGQRPVYKKFLSLLSGEGFTVSWGVLDASDYGVPQRRRRLVLLAGRGICIPFAAKMQPKKTVRDAIGHLKLPGKSGDPLHDIPERRSPRMRVWIAAIPKDGGSRRDLPKAMQRPCHQRTDGFKDVYGRMAWERPAPTITGGCFNPSKGRFLHPDQDRNITMREAALLQGFPGSFQVPPGTAKTSVALMIGNALPPDFVQCHAHEVAKSLLALRDFG